MEISEGSAPVLLIAPHGGRANPATSSVLHPKVNDLHTADITRELAARIGATSLINAGMDRNTLDCNRVGQLAEQAPWLLDTIAMRLEEMIARHGRASVLLIHGWNVIEPRIDFGLGLKAADGVFRAHGAARVSASDAFIHGPLKNLADRLRESGVIPTVGLRYPGGGSQNLLQAFTERFRESQLEPLRRLAKLAATGVIEALQLELSVAVRWPGALRHNIVEILAETFSQNTEPASPAPTPITVIRNVAKSSSPKPVKRPATLPVRLGMEVFDPSARIGIITSFDLGESATGARFILLLNGRQIALFTSEGKPTHNSKRIARGPLALRHEGNRLALEFNGPALISPDNIGYLSVEDSLAAGTLQETTEIAIAMNPFNIPPSLHALLEAIQQPASHLDGSAAFGSATGRVTVEGHAQPISGIGRIGRSFSALGNIRFDSRRMLWAHLPSHPRISAIEALVLARRDGGSDFCGRIFTRDGSSSECMLKALQLDAPSESAPNRISALVIGPEGVEMALSGEAEIFLPLSRPGHDQSRVLTWLGFARFHLDGHEGAGMFEHSSCTEASTAASDADE